MSRPEDRRRNLRLRATSLIYAQIGSDNGGVVVNLGPDGMSCQAAHKLIANQNSTITLKLRGSGLNVEIAGQVVWLGATQKEVGISFKSLSTTVKQDIADWIVRESGPAESGKQEQGAPQRSISEIAEMAVPEKETIPRSLSAALALARAMSADHASPAPQNLNNPDRASALDSSVPVLPVVPKFEIFPTTEHSRAAADSCSVDSEDTILDRTPAAEPLPDNVVEFPEKDRLSDDSQILGLPPLSVLKHSLAEAMQEIVPPPKVLETTDDAPPQLTAEVRPPDEIQRGTSPPAAPAVPVSPNLRRPSTAEIAERWIPPILLDYWKRLDAKRKQLLTHAGAGFLGLVIGLTLILVVTHLHFPGGQSVPQRQATVPPAAQSVDMPDHLPEFKKQEPPTPSTIPSINQPQSPEPSTLAKIANSIFGTRSASSKISDYQMGLEVWTSQSSGYYYCSDDPYVKSVESGVAMLQGDALQAGYRPRLGQFCN